MLTSASRRAAHTSFNMAFNTWTQTQVIQLKKRDRFRLSTVLNLWKPVYKSTLVHLFIDDRGIAEWPQRRGDLPPQVCKNHDGTLELSWKNKTVKLIRSLKISTLCTNGRCEPSEGFLNKEADLSCKTSLYKVKKCHLLSVCLMEGNPPVQLINKSDAWRRSALQSSWVEKRSRFNRSEASCCREHYSYITVNSLPAVNSFLNNCGLSNS